MRQSTQTFEEYLRTTFSVVDRKSLKNEGIRVWRISGDYANSEGSLVKASLELARRCLPADTRVLVFQDSIINYYFHDGSFRDEYAIMLCNSSWSKVQPGDRIPEIEVLFHNTESKVTPVCCTVREIKEISKEDFAGNLKLLVQKEKILSLLDLILDPQAESRSVISLAGSIKENLYPSKLITPDPED